LMNIKLAVLRFGRWLPMGVAVSATLTLAVLGARVKGMPG